MNHDKVRASECENPRTDKLHFITLLFCSLFFPFRFLSIRRATGRILHFSPDLYLTLFCGGSRSYVRQVVGLLYALVSPTCLCIKLHQSPSHEVVPPDCHPRPTPRPNLTPSALISKFRSTVDSHGQNVPTSSVPIKSLSPNRHPDRL